eukprot:gnl/Dysnectes_brevis/564_a622_2755.p1 GENE.gnl/Dysnectes_brevis/564_a622_2755~~gnl/Dysnectes_brevis/564_a622_2755.p1  ORF type:complete len:405 (+),score=130.96 gnl/Dysnectes_brevis/564_a622_2755:34-1248(+)
MFAARVPAFKDDILSIAFSPNPSDPTLCLAGSVDETAVLVDIATQAVIHTLPDHTDSITCTGFSHDGSRAITAGLDGKVMVWDVATGALLCTAEGPGDGIEWMRIHPKHDVVLVGAMDGSVWMWQFPKTSPGESSFLMCVTHDGPVTCGSFTPNGKLIITGSADGSLRIWSPVDGSMLKRLDLGRSVTCVQTYGKKKGLSIVGMEDGRLCMVNNESGRLLHTIRVHKESVEGVIMLDKKWCASLSIDGTVNILDLSASGALRHTFKHRGGFTVGYLVSRSLLLVGTVDGYVKALDPIRRQVLFEAQVVLDGPVLAISAPNFIARAPIFVAAGSPIVASFPLDPEAYVEDPEEGVPSEGYDEDVIEEGIDGIDGIDGVSHTDEDMDGIPEVGGESPDVMMGEHPE